MLFNGFCVGGPTFIWTNSCTLQEFMKIVVFQYIINFSYKSQEVWTKTITKHIFETVFMSNIFYFDIIMLSKTFLISY